MAKLRANPKATVRKTAASHSGVDRTTGVSALLAITEFGEDGYQIIKSIPVALQREDEAYVASFFEANVHASGQTDQEAFDNLRSMILDTYDSLVPLPESSLGPSALRQWKVLCAFMKGPPA